jgi:hypothetical protein
MERDSRAWRVRNRLHVRRARKNGFGRPYGLLRPVFVSCSHTKKEACK